MGRKGASRNRGAGGAAAGQSQSGKKRGPSGFTLRNSATCIAGLAVVVFILLPSGPNTNHRNPHADDESLDHAELGSRGLAVRTST